MGLAVGSEQPFLAYSGDLLDVTDPSWAVAHPEFSWHVYTERPAKIHLEFPIKDGRASDPEGLLVALAAQLNARLPFEFQIRKVIRPDFTMYSLVPNATHDEQGRLIHPVPYMDIPIDIPAEQASVAALGSLVADHITQETGNRFSCCQSYVAGQPWGGGMIEYEASRKPAREILTDFLQADGRAESYWAACEPHMHYCHIEVQGVNPSPGPNHACRSSEFMPIRWALANSDRDIPRTISVY